MISGYFGTRRCSPRALSPQVSRRRRASRAVRHARRARLDRRRTHHPSVGDHRAARGRRQGHRLPRLRGWSGRARLGRSDPNRLHQPGWRVDRRQLHARRWGRLRRPVHQRAGRRHRRSTNRDRPVLHRQRRRRGPAVRPGVRQRRLDRRRHQRSDGHRHAVVLCGAGRVQAGGPRRVGESGRHHPAKCRRPQWRCGLHPRPVRHVRQRGARRRIGGADLLGGDPVRRRRRAGVGVRGAGHSDRGRAVLAEHARPHRPVARRRGPGCRHRDAGDRRARVRQVRRGPAGAGDPRREGARQPGVLDPGRDRGVR